MTERRTNRLTSGGGHNGAAYVEVNGEQVPTDLDGYCAWLNSKERRRGRWIVTKAESGRRSVDFVTQVASDGWLMERGLIPKIGRAA